MLSTPTPCIGKIGLFQIMLSQSNESQMDSDQIDKTFQEEENLIHFIFRVKINEYIAPKYGMYTFPFF